MDKFQNKYRIPSARAGWHIYDGGAYFVTICTAGMAHMFGEVVDVRMRLSCIGRIAYENLSDVSAHYPYAEIPLFVVMPNHIHAVVIIDGSKTPYNRRNHVVSGPIVETWRAASLSWRGASLQPTPSEQANKRMQHVAYMQGWLSVVIGGLKSAITKYARQYGIPFAWQARFYDRIIRCPDEMNRIAEYIENNVYNWESDEMNR